ncbi:MAG TPA: hypothetical protein ENJ31_04265 [Anaerolineae bacterium]|nr:hypothetical protein [Anaerolineae bacterium]
MNCRQTRRLLSVQREWTEEERSAVQKHLAGCPACQAVAREYELMDRRLGRLPEPLPATALWPAIRARTITAGMAPASQPASRLRWAFQGMVLIALIALLTFLALGWRAGLMPTAGPSPSTGPWASGASAGATATIPLPTPQGMTETRTIIYGIQVQMMLDQEPAPVIEAVHDLGFGWVKQQVRWADIEPQPGEFRWDVLDRTVASLDDAGVHLLLNVVGSPRWAWPQGASYEVMGPPADPADFAAFMGALAARYRGRIGAYEIWQEQNIDYAWGGRVDVEEYMALLQKASQAIRSADPDALVLSGGLTPTGAPPPHAMDDARYLAAMYRLGLKTYADAVGVHLPTYNLPPDADWRTFQDPSAHFRGFEQFRHRSWSFRGTAEAYREVMEANNAADHPLWVTEFGWAVSDDPPRYWEHAGDNTPQEQAEFTLRALAMAEKWDWVEAMFLWNLNFAVVAPDSKEAMWSIVGPDWERTETFEALTQSTQRR